MIKKLISLKEQGELTYDVRITQDTVKRIARLVEE